jgi:hypothetical protein
MKQNVFDFQSMSLSLSLMQIQTNHIKISLNHIFLYNVKMSEQERERDEDWIVVISLPVFMCHHYLFIWVAVEWKPFFYMPEQQTSLRQQNL